MKLPKVLRAARAHANYATSHTSPFDFLTAGNRGNDMLDAMRGGGRLQGDQTAAIEALVRATDSATRRRG